MKYRQEKDSIGIVNVPEDALWGAQTQHLMKLPPRCRTNATFTSYGPSFIEKSLRFGQ